MPALKFQWFCAVLQILLAAMGWTIILFAVGSYSPSLAFVLICLLCFYSFALNKNIWQTSGLGIIYQPNHA